jgi:2-dehydropantoate 2-reductase
MDTVYVVGAGGIGCAVGYSLLAAGRRVVFVETDSAKIAWGQRYGVAVNHNAALAAEFVAFADWVPTVEAWVLLCTKCYDNGPVMTKLPANVRLVPIQNGFDTCLDGFGHQQEGIASFVARCVPGTTTVEITRPGDLHLGWRAASGKAGRDLLQLASGLMGTDLFRVRFPYGPIEPIKYAKLMYNSAISPLAAAAGVDNGELLADPLARRLFFGLLRENYAILSAAGIELGTVGPFHPRTVDRILRRRWLARMMARFFQPSLRGTYCSMAGEIEKGRTEIDNYNGHLIRLAGNRMPCPLNRAVYDLVLRMTGEQRAPDRSVLAELANAV